MLITFIIATVYHVTKAYLVGIGLRVLGIDNFDHRLLLPVPSSSMNSINPKGARPWSAFPLPMVRFDEIFDLLSFFSDPRITLSSNKYKPLIYEKDTKECKNIQYFWRFFQDLKLYKFGCLTSKLRLAINNCNNPLQCCQIFIVICVQIWGWLKVKIRKFVGFSLFFFFFDLEGTVILFVSYFPDFFFLSLISHILIFWENKIGVKFRQNASFFRLFLVTAVF